MSVKKILLLTAATAAVISASQAIAGGYTNEPVAAEVSMANNGYYIEGNVGYAFQNYYDTLMWRNGGIQAGSSNVTGGFAAGVDTGYDINKNYAVELGWYYLPSVNVAGAGAASSSLTSWALYLAAKYMVPLGWHDTDWFSKVGVMYRSASLPNNMLTQYNVTSGTSSFVRPMFATGFSMGFATAWNAVLQYAYFMGARNSFPLVATPPNNNGSLSTVAANVITLGLGYKFMM